MYGHPQPALVLALFVALGMAFKHWMSHRSRSHRGVLALGLASFVVLLALTVRPAPPAATAAAPAVGPVPFTAVRAIVARRCMTCHTRHPSNPSFSAPPAGVMFDDPERLRALAPRIRVRAVETRTMPLGNLTGMTQAERDTLAAWIAQGANGD